MLPTIDLESCPPEILDELRKVMLEETIKEAREDLYTFVRLLAPILLPEGFRDGRHIKFICNELMLLERSIIESQESGGRVSPLREQFSLPPGGMKSLLISKFFVAWCLGRHPTWNIIQLGHSTDFARDNFGRKVKELISSQEYRAIFPDTRIKSDARAADRFELTAGGVYFCTGAGSAITGRRAHLLISDDVLTEHSAYSEKERNGINNWYVPGARSRLLPWGGEVMVATKWHLDDLMGYMNKMDRKGGRPWKAMRIPAIIDEDSSLKLGIPVGESFWPELWPLNVLLDKKLSHTPSQWAALFMQNPIPEEGSMIKAEWIQWWDEKIHGPIKVDYVVASIDSSFGNTKGTRSKTSGDYTAITVWGCFITKERGQNNALYDKRQMILLGARRGRWAFHELVKVMDEIKKNFDPDLFLVEKKGSGISLIQELEMLGYPLYEYSPDKDKEARVYASTRTFHAGNIWFVKDKMWARDVLQELITYPYAPNDDYVDTTTQAVLWLRKGFMLSQQGEYGYEEDEEEDPTRYQRNSTPSYWDEAQPKR